VIAADGGVFFIEMNTRLQVEHPVTEMITGLDLVEWQLRVASGEALPLRQDQLAINGHAIEARIYAEDPDKGFLPATGKLLHLVPPEQNEHVRVDTGVEQGDSISPHYDPMIAKLIVWDHDRTAALARMRQALAAYQVVGVANNIGLLSRLVASNAFSTADLDTALIEREHEHLFGAPSPVPDEVWLLAAWAELQREIAAGEQAASASADRDSPWRALDGWRLNGRARRTLTLRHGDQLQDVQVEHAAAAPVRLSLGETSVLAQGTMARDGIARVQLGDRRVAATVVADNDRRTVFHAGRSWALHLLPRLQEGGDAEVDAGGVLAPMPGKVIALLTEPGAAVDKGTPLLVLEAMKMEHTLTAPHAGTVKSFRFAPGDQVGEGVELIDFEVQA
jgi:3-methylcrotonyl-CoA carboxylase alpha subunit